MATIELKHIHKRFDKNDTLNILRIPFRWPITAGTQIPLERSGNAQKSSFAIEDLTLTIPDGKVMVILGPSSCGKSTLLRLIGGLMQPNSGEIHYDGVDMKNIPPGERKIGMLFQNYALYPHFTSKSNILSYFFFKKKTPELDQLAQEKYQKTSELLGVDIEYLLDKSPAHLSGGEKQRVALGRCITREPALFLLDEPFSNLDQPLRVKYRAQLKKLLRHFKITTVYVTHDQYEALLLADVLAIMNIGSVEQVGTSEEIYNHPYSLFVAEFLNVDPDTPPINLLEFNLIEPYEEPGIIVGVRPEDIVVSKQYVDRSLTGVIEDIRHLPLQGATTLCANIDGNELHVRVSLEKDLQVNDRVYVRFRKYHLFDKSSGRRVRTEEIEKNSSPF